MEDERFKCHNCMEYKKGECFGEIKGTCKDYKHSPIVPEEIIKLWPTTCQGPYEYDYHETYRYLWGNQ